MPATPDEAPHKPRWGIWDERNADTLEQRRRCYLDSEMCECSDDEYWRSIRYGPPCADSPDEESEESSISNDTMLRYGTRLAFDPTPMVSHLTLPPFWGRVECEKVAFLAAKKRSRR